MDPEFAEQCARNEWNSQADMWNQWTDLDQTEKDELIQAQHLSKQGISL